MQPCRIANPGWKRSSPMSKSPGFLAIILIGIGAVLPMATAMAQKIPPGNDPGNNNPPPASAILDLAPTPIPGGGNETYQMYSVNFTASLANTAITFAFREDPAFLFFSNASVIDVTSGGGNLLVNGNFAGATYTDNGNVATPVGWEYANVYGATFGGVVLPNCGVGPGGALGTSNCWYDGAVQAYDALTQTIATVPGHNYQISFWLADNSGCAIDGGSPCYFSDLSTNGDVTDTGGNGIDLTVYVGAALPSPDALRVELGWDGSSPSYPNDKMLATATAMNTSGSQATMEDAASKMGFDHFNWIQFVVSSLLLQACSTSTTLQDCASAVTSTGSVPTLPAYDPAVGGYAYESSTCYPLNYPATTNCLSSFPVQDYWPMYLDEYFAPVPGTLFYTPNPSSPEYFTQYRQGTQLQQTGYVSPSQALGFSFEDRPTTNYIVPNLNQTENDAFVTALVGISGTCNTLTTGGNCAFQIFPGTTFQWASTNGNVSFGATPGASPNVSGMALLPPQGAGSGDQEHPAKRIDDFYVNPLDLTGSQLEGSLISTAQFLQLAGLTPQSLASIGGGISIFSGSLIPSEAAALAAAQSGTPPTDDNQIQVFAMPNTYTYPGSTVVTVKLLPGTNPTHAPTGTVHLMLDGDTLPTTLTLRGSGHGYAAAYYDLTEVSAGAHLLSASYSGDANNPAGVSQPIRLQVASAPVKLAVSCQNATLLYTASYKCEVYTQPINAGSNTSIAYQFDSASPATVPLNGGTATFTIPTPSMGPHTVVISYAAQGNYAAATSQTENFTVIPH